MPVADVRLYYLRQGVEQVSHRSQSQLQETVEWMDASAIHKEKRWEPCVGAGCATCAFHTLCPAKTGQARPNKTVWEQGNLLWEMQEEATAPAVAARPARTIRQMTIDDFLG